MGRQIKVHLERTIPARPARIHAALADYRGRSRILPGNYLDYRVEEAGEGGGTVVSYRLRAGRRTFAPRGLRRIHGELLDGLTRQVGAEPVDGA